MFEYGKHDHLDEMLLYGLHSGVDRQILGYSLASELGADSAYYLPSDGST